MKFYALLFAVTPLATLVGGCKSVDCGDGTTERSGKCVAADETVTNAKCGPFTELQGNVCVPQFPPTVCDPATTAPDTDEMGVTTCVATGVAGCSIKLACPTPAQGKQTVCGQVYDFETGAPFAEAGAKGAACATDATSGPCSIAVRAFDAGALLSAGASAKPVAVGVIDDCGRYTVPDIPVSDITSQILVIGIDDRVAGSIGPAGTTNNVGLATAATNGTLKDFDAFVVPAATSTKWANSGGPNILSVGILAAVYRAHSSGSDLASGVSFKTLRGTPTTTTYYLSGAMRSTVDAGLSATAQNGTALVTITNGMPTDLYYGQGGIDPMCMWSPQPALTIMNAILIENFRPTAISGMTCPL